MASYQTQDILDANGNKIGTRIITVDPLGRQCFADVPVSAIAGIDPGVVVAAVAAQAITNSQNGGTGRVVADPMVDQIALAAGATLNAAADVLNPNSP